VILRDNKLLPREKRKGGKMSVLDTFKLDGQVALVTGGGSGLGWAMAEAMAEAGADIVCVDIVDSRAYQAAESIRTLGRRGVAITADVSKEADVKRMVDQTVAELGRLDIVIANAGISPELEAFLEEPLERWQQVIDVDLNSVFLTCREAAKVMIPRRRGKIITISSIHGAYVGNPEGRRAGYCAAKGGVVGLTWTLAIILAPYGIQVNCIAPGIFKTQLGRGLFMQKEPDERTKQMIASNIQRIPLGRIAEPSEIKGLALLLASSASDYMTGCVIPIDGGYTAW
jgi:NAD(P)-dependent dehydrogenase (short-subunit alcohol dehydrogenase family)